MNIRPCATLPMLFLASASLLVAHDHHRGCDHDCYWEHGHRIQRRTVLPIPNQIQTIEGSIVEIIYLPAGEPGDALIDLRLRTDAQLNVVRIGPASLLKRAGMPLKEGETVSLKGFLVDGLEGSVVVCTEVRHGQKVVRLRDEQGRPLW